MLNTHFKTKKEAINFCYKVFRDASYNKKSDDIISALWNDKDLFLLKELVKSTMFSHELSIDDFKELAFKDTSKNAKYIKEYYKNQDKLYKSLNII